MSRGVSTVIDVVIALSLVSAAAVVLVTASPPASHASVDTAADAVGSTVLATTVTVTYDGPNARRTVRGPAGTLLADAAVAARPPRTPSESSFVAATRVAVSNTLDTFADGVSVAAVADGGRPVTVGGTPPPRTSVEAATYRFPRDGVNVTLVVRTWSA